MTEQQRWVPRLTMRRVRAAAYIGRHRNWDRLVDSPSLYPFDAAALGKHEATR